MASVRAMGLETGRTSLRACSRASTAVAVVSVIVENSFAVADKHVGHPSCMGVSQNLDRIQGATWKCAECKTCEVCGEKSEVWSLVSNKWMALKDSQ